MASSFPICWILLGSSRTTGSLQIANVRGKILKRRLYEKRLAAGNFQVPSLSEIPTPTIKPNQAESARLEFADWRFLGAWDLGFGYSTTASRLGFARSPKIAVPTLTSVAPSSTAIL
jgi:hypothetical protein